MEAVVVRDDWQSVTQRTERKKIQNRLNQRALRQRKKKDEIKILTGKQPYGVTRWRVEQFTPQQAQQVLSKTDENDNSSPSSSPDPNERKFTQLGLRSPETASAPTQNCLLPVQSTLRSPQTRYPTPPIDFPLSSDHLIRLVHLNVFSALMKNKNILSETTYVTKPHVQGPSLVLPPSRDFCDGLTVLHVFEASSLPSSLEPTALQATIPHASWHNMFPFPRFRDNLIVHESIFDGAELLHDLFGDAVGSNDALSSDMNDHSAQMIGDEDDIHAGRKGLVVWGEPWDTYGWEITPGFMRKWAWLLKGCEDLVAASNRWRAMRDEAPLRMEEIAD